MAEKKKLANGMDKMKKKKKEMWKRKQNQFDHKEKQQCEQSFEFVHSILDVCD